MDPIQCLLLVFQVYCLCNLKFVLGCSRFNRVPVSCTLQTLRDVCIPEFGAEQTSRVFQQEFSETLGVKLPPPLTPFGTT
mgnify:CR=1 FL=1